MMGATLECHAQKLRKNNRKAQEKLSVQQVRPDIENTKEFLPYFVENVCNSKIFTTFATQ